MGKIDRRVLPGCIVRRLAVKGPLHLVKKGSDLSRRAANPSGLSRGGCRCTLLSKVPNLSGLTAFVFPFALEVNDSTAPGRSLACVQTSPRPWLLKIRQFILAVSS